MTDSEIKAMEAQHGEQRTITKLPGSNFIVFRSRDYAAIRKLALHPRIFPSISDDYTNDRESWKPTESELLIYLLAKDDQGIFGFAAFIPQTHVQYGAHMAFLPRSYGNLALTAFKEMLAWMWRETKARRLVGEVPRNNHLGIRFARRAGFEFYGINKRSTLRGGRLLDQVCLGISKPDLLSRQDESVESRA
jgi:RimJ/RimL family protein N-acetyltransferase